MSHLRSSAHFNWSTTCVLGKGATGAVYQGAHKSTCEPVAVKAFNHVSHLRPLEVQMREFEVMKKLKHESIVKMLAIEEEVESQKKILVMELCTGGSLFTILDDPQNSYGLEEAEFLCVLKDLSAGMKYLRDNNIIHRDLKPGNIMKFIAEDKRSIYKLTDFGAARELEDDQQFMSLYGTEEYLHPDMYGRAVLRYDAIKPFRATVDLWSIGVTLYHVATGSLPFRPFGGRKNRQTMHYITTKKASGVISGVQHSENGPIEWSRELPKTCLLNQGLRELVTSLLAGILECNDEKMWSFENFFSSVTDIVSRRAIHIFYMNEGKEVSLYMQPNLTLKYVKDQIVIQVKVPLPNQILLFDKSVFDNIVDVSAEIHTYPVTSYSQPLILLHSENTDVKDLTRLGALSACFPMFHTSSVNTDQDAALAKTCCSVAYAVQRSVEKLVRCRTLLLKTPNVLLSLAHDNVTKLCSNLEVLRQRVEDIDRRLNHLENDCSVVTEFLNIWPNKHACEGELHSLSQMVLEKKQLKEQVSQKFLSLQSAIYTLKQKVLISAYLQKQWDQALINCQELTGCIEKADTFVNQIRDCWQALVRDKGIRVLSFHDEQFHIAEKVKIQLTSKKLLALLKDQCLKSCLQASHKLDEWYSGMQATMVQCKCLEDDTTSVTSLVKCYASSTHEGELDGDKFTQIILSTLKTSQSSSCSISKEGSRKREKDLSCSCSRSASWGKNSQQNKALNDVFYQLQDLKQSQSGLWDIVKENDSMLERFGELQKTIEEKQKYADSEQTCLDEKS